VERVDEVLRQAGIDKEAIDAHTLRAELSMLQQIENLIAHGEARRHIILRELDRRRDMSETRSRSAPTRIEDAKFKELGPPKRSR
jgi:hypothetical protein